MKGLRNLVFRLVLAIPSVLLINSTITAQSDSSGESPVTTTYAVTNATILTAPGDTLKEATVVISNGLISSVGKNVTIPDNSEVIDGTDLIVYAGFIDGMSYTGADRPDQPQRPDNLFSPDPPNDYAGITPEIQVIEQIKTDENSIESMREVGFTISHTVPYGRMLPGSGALLVLKDAEHPDHLVFKHDVSMYSQFVGAPGAYPGNTLGIMAKFRNLYTNAENSRNHTMMYESNPAGIQRPTRDRVMEAFHPVVAKQKPIFYNASTTLTALRALRLQKELGFNLVLGNLQQGWELVDELKEGNAKVFLSLELPKEPKNSDDEDKTDEVKQLEEKRMDFYNKFLTQYSTMNEAGIKFGFSTIDIRANDVKKNLIRIIENGLSEDQALAALTTDAADLLGISDVAGTVEEGKLGNIIVSKGSYFDKDSQLKYVFVDGEKFEFEIKEKKANTNTTAGDASAFSDVIGVWNYSFTTPQGEQSGTMTITQDGGVLTGTMTSNDGAPDSEMLNVSYQNQELSFDFDVDAGGQSVNIVVVGTVSGGEYEAEATVAAFNNFTFPILANKETPEK